MKQSFILVIAGFLGGLAAPVQATDGLVNPLSVWQADPTAVLEGIEVNLDDFLWIARPLVIFADTPADPRFQEQIELILRRVEDLAERDVVIIADTDPAIRSELRTKLRPRGFMLALIGKDGGVKLRKPLPWDVRELSRVIDKMPMRQQEIRDRLSID